MTKTKCNNIKIILFIVIKQIHFKKRTIINNNKKKKNIKTHE